MPRASLLPMSQLVCQVPAGQLAANRCHLLLLQATSSGRVII